MKHRFLCLMLIYLLLLSGCGGQNIPNHTLHIAVMVSEKQKAEQYLKGIELAASEAQQKYKDYDIAYTVYEDFDDYEKGAAVVDTIVSDSEITAVLATDNMDISKLAAHTFETAGKLMIAPYALYDDELTGHNHKMVFSTCFSAAQIGESARAAAVETEAKRWAVCYADEEFSKQEARSFTAQKADDVVIVDTVKEDVLLYDFATVTNRWRQLGVEGIALFAYDKEVLDLFTSLKSFMPSWKFIGDYAMDDATYMEASPERMAAFEGVSIVSQFYVEQDDELLDTLVDMLPEDELYFDTWMVHGYNNFKMIIDTAVKNETNQPKVIADALRLEGYDGVLQTFSFDESGQYDNTKIVYDVFLEGEWQAYEQESEVDGR